MPTTPPDPNDLPDDIPDVQDAAATANPKKTGRQRRPTLMGALPAGSLEQGQVGGAELANLDETGQEEATVAFVLTPELLARMGVDDEPAPVATPAADLPDAVPVDLPDAAPVDLPDAAPADLPDAGPADLPSAAPADLSVAAPSAGLPSYYSAGPQDEERTVAFVPPPGLFADFDESAVPASAPVSAPASNHRHAGTEAYSIEAPLQPAAAANQISAGHRHAATEAYSSEVVDPADVSLPASPVAATSAPATSPKPATPSKVAAAPKAASPSKGKSRGKGVSLLELMKANGSMNGEEAVLRMCKIANAVQQLHAANQSHGALTPAHIRFVPDVDGDVELVSADRVKLAERFSSQYEAPEISGGVQTETTTPMRSDVYALGCILFNMLTGAPPFRGKTPEEIRKRHAKFAVPAVRQIRADVEMPPALEVQLQQALKKRPADRPACAGDFAQAIAYATADDDRGTVHLQGDQAKLLQELIEQKTQSRHAQQELEAERRATEEEKKAAAQQKAHAMKEAARASEEAARASEEAARSEQEQRSARRSKKKWITIAVAGLILSIGATTAFYVLYEAEEIIIEKEVEKIVTQEKIVTHEKIVEKKIFVDGGTRVIYVEKDAGVQKKRRPHHRKKRKRVAPASTKPATPPPFKANDGPAVF